GKGAFARVAARGHHTLEFTATDDIKAAAQIGKRPQNGLVRIGFCREADQVAHAGHGAVELAKMFRESVLRIDVKRRAKLFSERFDGDTLAEEFVADITKVMHAWLITARPEP